MQRLSFSVIKPFLLDQRNKYFYQYSENVLAKRNLVKTGFQWKNVDFSDRFVTFHHCSCSGFNASLGVSGIILKITKGGRQKVSELACLYIFFEILEQEYDITINRLIA